MVQGKLDSDIKLFTYNMIQTPNGAKKVSLSGPFFMEQRTPFAMGSVKREAFYDTDTLVKQLQSKTILEFINYINNKNVTAQFQIDNSFI